MNGQTGKIVGNLPVSKGKAGGLGVLVFAIIAAIGFFAFNAFFESATVGAIMGVILGLIITGGIMAYLVRQIHDVVADNRAAAYRKEGSFQVTRKSDRFMYRDRRVIRKK